MKIKSIRIKNYRSIVDCEFSFIGSYTAISGKNNAGKSNILRVIRIFLDKEYEFVNFFEKPEETKIDFSEDYPAWEESDGTISLQLDLEIHKELDAGLFRFVTTILGNQPADDSIQISLGLESTEESIRQSLEMKEDERMIPIDDYFKVQEIHKKLKSSEILNFHNSTKRTDNFFARNSINLFNEISPEDRKKLGDAQEKLSRALKKIAQKHQGDIKDLLGKLADHYEVNISTPTFSLASLPFIISLGDKNYGVPLEAWGSGTQNRTSILLSLLSAKKIIDSAMESDKITPILIIEEPESFLHPSAQAEFGNILRELSREFDVQVIATTHSPYMLSLQEPECNLLLERKIQKTGKSFKILETELIDTAGEGWMEPFALALGISNSDLEPWKSFLFQDSSEILLVEGSLDKEYFSLLRDEKHEANKLEIFGEIFPYGGTGFFDNPTVLQFMINRHPRICITYDYDHDVQISKKLQKLGLKKGEDFIPVGFSTKGKDNVEGLLPSRIREKVYADNSDLVDRVMAGDKQAKKELKAALLEEFKSDSRIGSEDFKDFYSVVKKINKIFRKKRS